MNLTMLPIHFDLTVFTMGAFFMAFVACVAGLFYSRYVENWLQHVGMIAVGLASALKVQQIYHRGFVTPETALLGLGVAIFALGVARKVWQHQREDPPQPYHGPERRRHERRTSVEN